MSVKETNTQRGIVNGVDLDQLTATIDAVRGERTLGEVTFAVEGQWEDGFKLRSATGALTQAGQKDASRAGKFEMRSDEPAPVAFSLPSAISFSTTAGVHCR